MSVARRRRWDVGLVGTLALLALGLTYADALLLTAAAVPLGYVVVGALSSLPADASLAVERDFEPSRPGPGERVTVTLTVRNDGDATLPDVRIVDGVPDAFTVVSGSPRAALSLRPGATATLGYDVVATRGDHDFSDPLVRVRTLPGTHLLTERFPASGEATLACHGLVTDPPAVDSLARAGSMQTSAGGEGLEFHSTREYRPGDAISRVDWRRFARTDELSTVKFVEERTARVTLVVDARPTSRAASRPGFPTGSELAAYAAERTYAALVAAGHVASVTALGLDGTAVDDAVTVGPDGLPWVGAGVASGTGARATALFGAARRAGDDADSAANDGDATDGPDSSADGETVSAALAADGAGRESRPPRTPSDPALLVERLRTHLSSDAGVVLFSPLLDDYPADAARELAAYGYDVLVLSPDVVGDATPGQTLTGVRRRLRLAGLDGPSVTTADWDPETPLDLTLERTLPRFLS